MYLYIFIYICIFNVRNKDVVNCWVKNYIKVDYRSYRRNFGIMYKPENFSGFLFATAKVASITVMIYFHMKNIL